MTAKAICSEETFVATLAGQPVLGEYRLAERLGEGSFGIVYKCIHIRTNKVFAVKFLKIWSVPEFAKKNLIQRFELEFETGKISSPYLVQTYIINKLENVPYFICDYCSGGNLERKINSGLINSEVINIAKCVLLGLYDLHNNGKIHRDLKPENILFDADGIPKLTDFGISGHMNVQLTRVNHDDEPSQIFGSYAYMAPEQTSNVVRKNTLLPTVDIFSFGVLLYEMFTRNLPFGPWNNIYDMPGYLINSRNGVITPVRNYNQHVPEIWQQLILRCLEADREKRFQNVEEILQRLEYQALSKSSPVQTMHFRLVILDGEEHGRVIPVNVKGVTTIGRLDQECLNDICIRERLTNYISRKHATFEHIKGKIYLRDGQWEKEIKKWKNSKNGTFINGRSLYEHTDLELKYHDIITIGNTSLKIIK